jgi:hypothetical protein
VAARAMQIGCRWTAVEGNFEERGHACAEGNGDSPPSSMAWVERLSSSQSSITAAKGISTAASPKSVNVLSQGDRVTILSGGKIPCPS